jgi:GNAT superfamily N-acetyltransferase
MITYRTGNDLEVDAAIELYRASTLGERRPVDDRERMTQMFRNANLVVTAWEGDLLVGLARSLSDFSYCTYLSDLAVRASHQRQGIGRELIRRTREQAGRATTILLSAPKAVEYYPRIGFQAHPSAWTLAADGPLQ